ncbi:glutaminase A [Xanthobacter flavus]|uniref:glutaminase A n=1 Tax=Xanthobacter flavus TaxID=281 RepID=UPI001AE6B03A|nr:glutaminase A [Xanthobacter flavus]MBP2147995.1 glutaminase [Xanthobacter flavus]
MPHPLPTLETPLLRFIKETHTEFSRIDAGEVASYIPELGKANPDHFGIAVATTDGHVYEAGDTQVPFTIQSVSKAMVFALALDLLGAERVEAAIGVEPSGEAFNSIRLRADNKPFNAMVNAGAIACSGLIAESAGDEAFELIRTALGRFAGRDLGVDEAVFESERSTGDRNRAIAYLLRTYGGVVGDVDRLLDVYFRQCSVLVTARDLAVMGATFANHGVNPLTGDTVSSNYAVARTLAVMSSSGMYDFAGEWIYRVGVPAKSGVGGGILAALPSQLGLGTFSPRLDMHGNSVRGIRTCEAISEAFDLHMLSRRDDVRTCVVADYDFRTVPSKPGRQPHEQDILSARSGAIRAIELAGKLSFASMDYVTRRLTAPADVPEFLILNLHRVATITDAGLKLLTGLIKNQLPAGTTAVIAGVEATSPVAPQLKALREQGVRVRIFPTYDAAVEWAEDQVVYRHGGFSRIEVEADLSRQALLAGLSPQELADLSRLGTRVVFPAGTRIISANEPPARVYFLLRGMVNARSAGDVRLSTMIPGMVFGEMALIEQPRSTDVWADTEAVCVEVTADQFRAFQETHARAADRIMRNLAVLLAGRIRMATARIEMLTG